MTTPAKVDYVELCASSNEAAKAFYGKAFGWTFTDYGPDYVGFNDGAKESGGFQCDGTKFTPLPILYSDDLEATRQQVLAAGGQINGPDYEFPGGRRFHFTDPFGNELAVWTKC